KEIEINGVYEVSTENNELLEEIKKHSKKIILIIDESLSFNNDYPLNVQNKLYNIILNANTNIIIPTEKREISYLKLKEKEENANYYISIFDKEKLNEIKLFLYKNKFKIISIIDSNEAFYFYCKNNYPEFSKEKKVYFFEENNRIKYCYTGERIILDYVKNINANEINIEKIKEIIKIQNNNDIEEEIEIIRVENRENEIIKGGVIAYSKENYSGFLKQTSRIYFSPVIYNYLIKAISFVLIINLLINLTVSISIKKSEKKIKEEIKNLFMEYYPELKKIVKVIPQSINYNNRIIDKTEILNSYLNYDKKFLYRFRNIIKSLKKYQNLITLKNIEYNENSFDLTGSAENVRVINSLIEELKREENIREVNLIKSEYANILKSEGIDFVIKIVIKK
ncbi:MAG TPA: hypothetical protein PK189_11265, partial [bacterium]|nr:hypothetical protein [bacterium]